MRRAAIFSYVGLLALAGAAAGQVAQPLSLWAAQSVSAARVTATGRLQAVNAARLSPRLSGRLTELGTDPGGHTLDAGMMVTQGQVLFRLDETTFANNVAAAQAALGSATAALDNLKARTRDERLEQLRQAVAELDLKIADKGKDVARYQQLVRVDKTLPEKRLDDVQLELDTLQSQRKAAQARLDEAENGPTRTELAVAEARVAEARAALKSAQDNLRDTAVRAPFDGLITHRFKSPGEYLASTPPTEVLEVVSLDELEVEFRLPEAYYGRIAEGTTAVTLTSPLLASSLDGRITRVIREIDPAKGTFACRTAVTAAQRAGLLPGAFVTAQIQLAPASGEVVIPQRAVVIEGGKAAVFVVEGGRMKRREVEVGDKLTEGVLIKSGIKDGQQVIAGPAELLQDGNPLPTYLIAAASATPPKNTPARQP